MGRFALTFAFTFTFAFAFTFTFAIALAVWKPLYGKERIGKEKPYTATLSNGAWTVSGTPPLDALGGTAFARIARDDGRILLVSHGK